jgi:EAL domain-containing protein (putative c-di-GMP-specific phosphodiesterase class I)
LPTGNPGDPRPASVGEVASGEEAESRGKLLVVDDEPAIVRAFERVLHKAGYQVDGTTSGKTAMELIRSRSYDAVLSDLSMPGMDGIELLRAVRQHDGDMPVVLITAGPSLDSAVEALECGAFRYMMKPVNPEMLRKVVAESVALRRVARLKHQAMLAMHQNAPMPRDEGADAELRLRFDAVLSKLWLAFQPIACWSKRAVIGYEALLRSSEPTMLQPGSILEAAERLNRLADLGRAIRDKVAEAMFGADPQLRFFVNLHPQDLLDESLYLPHAPLSRVAQRVVLELTERASLKDVSDIQARIERLRALGYQVAVDDLGAGYAGLNSFTLLHPEVVKLDMALVRNLHREPTKRKLVASMIMLCRDLGVSVVAEGIEVTEERDTLIELGCDHLQGNLFARPAASLPNVAW